MQFWCIEMRLDEVRPAGLETHAELAQDLADPHFDATGLRVGGALQRGREREEVRRSVSHVVTYRSTDAALALQFFVY